MLGYRCERCIKIFDRMNLNLVDDNDLLLNKGDGLIVDYGDGRLGLIIVCPGCGKLSGSKNQKHTYDRDTQSYTPSIVHDVNLGGCGWHGWLTNGVFREC